MSEEEFQAALDEHPEDTTTRGAFADWLQEQGDSRAEGYRALWLLGKWPDTWGQRRWCWRGGRDNPRGWRRMKWYVASTLPHDWLKRLPKAFIYRSGEGAPRREVEDSAARAFSRLRADRRAELLSGAAKAVA